MRFDWSVDVLGTTSNMVKMTNREGMPKQAFSGKLKKAKYITPMGSPLGHQMEGHP
jgi:hypothetical protein